MEGRFSDHLAQTLESCKDVHYETMVPKLIVESLTEDDRSKIEECSLKYNGTAYHFNIINDFARTYGLAMPYWNEIPVY